MDICMLAAVLQPATISDRMALAWALTALWW